MRYKPNLILANATDAEIKFRINQELLAISNALPQTITITRIVSSGSSGGTVIYSNDAALGTMTTVDAAGIVTVVFTPGFSSANFNVLPVLYTDEDKVNLSSKWLRNNNTTSSFQVQCEEPGTLFCFVVLRA